MAQKIGASEESARSIIGCHERRCLLKPLDRIIEKTHLLVGYGCVKVCVVIGIAIRLAFV